MNVTSTGYYTTQYLDKYRIKPHRRDGAVSPGLNPQELPSTDKENRLVVKKPLNLSEALTLNRDKLIKSNSLDNLKPRSLPPSPTSPKSPKSSKSKMFKFSPMSKFNNDDKDDIEDEPLSDPDDLEQEITPAQLNIIQNRRQDAAIRKQLERRKRRELREKRERPDLFSGKDARRHSRKYSEFSDDDSDMSSFYYGYEEEPKKRFGYGDYYIMEKKKFDESPYKPKMYTHKTFKEVFENKNENIDRYNPMDFVFHNPNPEDEKNQKLKSALKNFQSKMGVNNYKDYDYYAQKKKDDEARKRRQEKVANAEIFVKNSSDDSDDDALIEYLPDETKQHINKNQNMKQKWKKKLRVLKRELGQDYIKSYHENINEKQRVKQRKGIKEVPRDLAPGLPARKLTNKLEELDDEDLDSSDITSDDERPANKNLGPNPNFNPVWNYVLSWLVYDTPAPAKGYHSEDYDTSDFSDVDETAFRRQQKQPEESQALVKAPARKRGKKKQKKPPYKLNLDGFKKNYKSMVTNWNQPASALFSSDLALETERRKEMNAILAKAAAAGIDEDEQRSIIASIMLRMPNINENPQEIELEVSSDFEDDQELYYNPLTGALDTSPPTSKGSMDTRSIRSSRRNGKKSNGIASEVASGVASHFGAPKQILLNINHLVRHIPLVGPMFSMIDTVRSNFPHLDTAVLVGELLLFTWFLYLMTLLVNAVCTAVQAVCAPMIAIGRLLNRIM